MSRLTPLWMDAGSYTAVQVRRLAGAIWPNGAVIGMAASIQANSMNIQIATGACAVPDAANPGAAYLCCSDAPETVTLTPATQGRIDVICVQPQEANTGWVFNVVSSADTANPNPPNVPAGQFAVAQVGVGGGNATLDGSPLTDRRSAPNPQGIIATTWGNDNATLRTATTFANAVDLFRTPAVPIVYGRYYRVRIFFNNLFAVYTAGAGVANIGISRSGTQLGDTFGWRAGISGFGNSGFAEWVGQSIPGTFTFAARIWRGANVNQVGIGSTTVSVEDLGQI